MQNHLTLLRSWADGVPLKASFATALMVYGFSVFSQTHTQARAQTHKSWHDMVMQRTTGVSGVGGGAVQLGRWSGGA